MTAGSGASLRWLPLVVGLVLFVAGAGCVTDAADGPRPSPTKKALPGAQPVTDPGANLTSAQKRWHFHDAWDEASVLTLFDGPVVLSLQADQVGPAPFVARSGRSQFTFPHDVLVPPETGHLAVTVTFQGAAGVPFTGLNLSYRPVSRDNFTPAGAVSLGEALRIPVDWWETDVPHAKVSGWAFLLEAAPDARGVAVANGTAHVTIQAARLREVMIDPPHGNPWLLSAVVPLTPSLSANTTGVKLGDGRYLVKAGATSASVRGALLEFGPANGTIVPEGSASVLVKVAWKASAPVDLRVRYAEPNSPSEGLMALVEEGAGYRVFAVEAGPKMWDSPYAYRSTWRFTLETKGPEGIINPDIVTVNAWVSRTTPEEALRALSAP